MVISDASSETTSSKHTITSKNVRFSRWGKVDPVESQNYQEMQVELDPLTRALVVDSETNEVVIDAVSSLPTSLTTSSCSFFTAEPDVATTYSIDDIIALLTVKLLVASSKCSQGLASSALGEIQSDKALPAACNRASTCDPCPVVFGMIQSLLTQLFTMLTTDPHHRVTKKPMNGGGKQPTQSRNKRKFELTKKYRVLLITLLTALARVLTVNLEYVDACTLSPYSVGLDYPETQQHRDTYSLVSRLLLSLCSLVSALTVDDDCAKRCQKALIRAITVGIKVFFPLVSHRILLLEVLLYKRKQRNQPQVDYKLPSNTSVTSILRHITPNAFEVNEETGVMNILAAGFPHPLIIALSLSDAAESALLDSLLGHYSSVATIELIINPEMSPTFRDLLPKGSPATTDVVLQVGDYVERGPDWIYGDQDGGSGSHGIVVQISSPWDADDSLGSNRNSNDGMCVEVVWFKTYCKNSYRWRVPSSLGDRLVNDIQVLRASFESKSTVFEEQQKYPRKQLQYTPEAVQNALTRSINTDVITKSSVITYLKEHAPATWLAEHNMHSQSVNTLVRKLTSAQLIVIYQEFYQTFSYSHGENEKNIHEVNADEVIHQVQHSLLNHHVLHIYSLSYSLAAAGVSSQGNEVVLLFLSVLQGVLMGVVDGTSCNQRVSYAEPQRRLVTTSFSESLSTPIGTHSSTHYLTHSLREKILQLEKWDVGTATK